MLTVALIIIHAISHPTDWEIMQKYPSLKDSFFEIYEAEECRPYIFMVIENWLLENPVITTTERKGRYTVTKSGRKYVPALVGDLNCDGVTNWIDYCIALEYFKRQPQRP